MRFGLIGYNLFERIALALGIGPRALLEPYGAAFGRGLIVATKLGIFDALDPDTMVSWQRDAGLRTRRPVRLVMGQGPIFVIGERG